MFKNLKLKNFFKKSSKSGRILRNIGAAVFGVSAASAGMGPEEVETVEAAAGTDLVAILEQLGMVIGALTALIAQFTGKPVESPNSPGGEL